MKKIFIICLIGMCTGALLAHCQSLTSQQVTDLQNQATDDQGIINFDTFIINYENSDTQNREIEINSLNRFIQDTQALINTPGNTVPSNLAMVP